MAAVTGSDMSFFTAACRGFDRLPVLTAFRFPGRAPAPVRRPPCVGLADDGLFPRGAGRRAPLTNPLGGRRPCAREEDASPRLRWEGVPFFVRRVCGLSVISSEKESTPFSACCSGGAGGAAGVGGAGGEGGGPVRGASLCFVERDDYGALDGEERGRRALRALR